MQKSFASVGVFHRSWLSRQMAFDGWLCALSTQVIDVQGFLEAEHDGSRRASHQSVRTLPIRETRAYWKIGDGHRQRDQSRSSFALDVTEGSPQTSSQSGFPRSCMLPRRRNSPQVECVTADMPRNCTMVTALRFQGFQFLRLLKESSKGVASLGSMT